MGSRRRSRPQWQLRRPASARSRAPCALRAGGCRGPGRTRFATFTVDLFSGVHHFVMLLLSAKGVGGWPGKAPLRVVGRSSGLKGAAHRCHDGLRPPLTPEPLRPSGGGVAGRPGPAPGAARLTWRRRRCPVGTDSGPIRRTAPIRSFPTTPAIAPAHRSVSPAWSGRR
jgi:hypothetical protein